MQLAMGSARAPRVVFGAPAENPSLVAAHERRVAPPLARCPAKAPGTARGARALPIFRSATARLAHPHRARFVEPHDVAAFQSGRAFRIGEFFSVHLHAALLDQTA